MAIVQNWLPPSRENWETVVFWFQFFPIITIFQWIQPWYGAGKTSGKSVLNIPGKIGWITMEAPGFITVLYIMATLPGELGIKSLPMENWVMATLFTIHYLYRAIIGPLISPSMSPIHILIWLFAVIFQLCNAISIGGWLGGFGNITRSQWQHDVSLPYVAGARMELGVMIWALGFVGNIWHDDELREIRRAATRNQNKRAAESDPSTGKAKAADGKSDTGVAKFYMIPQNGLFWWLFYPHYLLEWIEWSGYWVMAGLGCVPARSFVLNEISTMLPRAIQGKRWYIKRFGKEKVGGRKAVIPGLV